MGEGYRDPNAIGIEAGGMNEVEAEARTREDLARVEKEIIDLEKMMQPQAMSSDIRPRERGDVARVAVYQIIDAEKRLKLAKDKRENLNAQLAGYAARRQAREKK